MFKNNTTDNSSEYHHQSSGVDNQNLKQQMSNKQQQHYLTIEELRLTFNSCWLCGCNWQQDHISLYCPECGGYALTRPCPNCDGKCKQIWKRNVTATHDLHRAHWIGHCNQSTNGSHSELSMTRDTLAAMKGPKMIPNSNGCSPASSSDSELDSSQSPPIQCKSHHHLNQSRHTDRAQNQ